MLKTQGNYQVQIIQVKTSISAFFKALKIENIIKMSIVNSS